MAEPKTGDTCMPMRGTCMFGSKVCDCLNGMNTWACWDPATDCPAMRPAERDACNVLGSQCRYGMGRTGGGCQCTDMGWDCGRQYCPPAEPASATMCEPGPGTCMYSTRICECGNDTNMWACWDPADCPASQPAEQSTCDPVGMTCDYGEQGGNDCDCEATGWDCGAQFCPPAAPTPAEACEGGDGVCNYDAATVCDCDSQVWACWNPADCPAMPMEAAACTTEGMICMYGTGSCECNDLLWECDLDDADGGT